MKCPSCNSENNDEAKFCKKCGAPLKSKVASHESMLQSLNEEQSDNTTKIIIIALIAIVVVLAGAFIYLQGFGSDTQAQDSSSQQSSASSSAVQTPAAKPNTTTSESSQPVQASAPTQTTSSSSSSQSSSQSSSVAGMRILGGNFYTGSELEDLTYASIYVGKEYAGQSVIIQIWYSRDGSTLNNGNMVPVTVHSDGYIEVSSADAYAYYPDRAEINLYDSNSHLLDTQIVTLTPDTGTQYF